MNLGLEQGSDPWLSPALDTVCVAVAVAVAGCAGRDFREAPLETRKNPSFLREKSMSWMHQPRERAFAGLENS